MLNKQKTNLETVKFSEAMSGEDYYDMIAECAYYKAEKRGFESGYEMADWCEAEQEIEHQIKSMQYFM